MLETEYLKLKYHNNVDSNTDEVDAEEYFNNNYKKIDANAKKVNADLIKIKEDLEKENNELVSNMPWNTVQGKSLHITDSAKYSKNRLEISGDMEQEKRSGKNLIPLSANRTLNGVTLSVDENGIYTLNGTATNNCFFRISLKKVLPSGTSKTMSLNVLGGTATGDGAFYFAFRVRNSNDVYSNAPDMAETQYKLNSNKYTTKTITNECATAEITVLSGVTLNNVKLTIQLEEGTTATEFEKYGAMPSTEFPSMPLTATGIQKIRQFGKNWLNKSNINKLNAVVDTSSITANSSAKSFYIKVKSDTAYTISRKIIGARFVVGTTANIPKIGEAIIDRVVNNSGSSITLITSKNANYLVVYYLYNSNENEQEILDNIQIEEDSTATTCEPYWEQIHTLDLGTTQLCAIKDTNGNVVAKDREVYRNGKWQWEKKIKKRVLNGTENWYVTGTDTSGVNRFGTNTVFADAQPATSVNVIQPCVCDKLKTVTAGNTYNKVEGISISILHSTAKTTAVYIYTEETKNMTIAEFKTWLGANNLTVYYVLATPEYIDCTAEQSAVLDKLYNNFELNKGTNNIIVESSNGVGVNLELEYMQDNVLKHDKDIAELKQAIVALGGVI